MVMKTVGMSSAELLLIWTTFLTEKQVEEIRRKVPDLSEDKVRQTHAVLMKFNRRIVRRLLELGTINSINDAAVMRLFKQLTNEMTGPIRRLLIQRRLKAIDSRLLHL